MPTRLIDLPAVKRFEDAATITPALRSLAGAARSTEFEGLCQSLFGQSYDVFGPMLPPGYELGEDGYVYWELDREEGPEDLRAWAKFEADAELFANVYVGLTARSESDLLSLLREHGWDAADGRGRLLYCALPLSPLLVASSRGDFGVPKLGAVKVAAEDWGAALAAEASRFRPRQRR